MLSCQYNFALYININFTTPIYLIYGILYQDLNSFILQLNDILNTSSLTVASNTEMRQVFNGTECIMSPSNRYKHNVLRHNIHKKKLFLFYTKIQKHLLMYLLLKRASDWIMLAVCYIKFVIYCQI